MGTITASIKRKGRVVGRSQIACPEGDKAAFRAALDAVNAEAAKQAKQDFEKRHTGRKAFRRKKPGA